MRRLVRVTATVVLTALAVAYLAWKVDLDATLDVLADTDAGWSALAVGIMIVTVLPMAVRWQWLMAAEGMHERLPWLTRAYFVSYAAGQILPTGIGGDAVRVVETARRHSGRALPITAIVLLERALGGAATVCLAAVGFLLAVGRYDVGAYLWVELVFVVGTVVLGFLFFARSARPLLARGAPLARALRLERPLRAFYEAVHAFGARPRLLFGVFALTLALQSVRVLAIWASARAVGLDLSPRLFYVMGPLFFLVLLVPFTLNGFAVREAFFVSFLGTVGADADAAFAAGLVFFLVTLAAAAPGGLVLLWEGFRGPAQPRVGHG